MEGLESNTIPQHDPGPLSEMIDLVQDRIHQVIVGQHDMVEQLLAGLLADGHILIEGCRALPKHLRPKCWPSSSTPALPAYSSPPI